MFSFALNDVLFHLKPARPGAVFPDTMLKGIDAQLASTFQRAAEKALSRPIPEMKASDWILFGDRYAQARLERRELLLSLALGEAVTGSGRYLMKMIDLAWAITEESTWANTPDIALVNAPEEDDLSFETAALLAWVWQLCGKEIEKISREVCFRIEDSVAMRILTPFTAQEIPEWAQRRGGRTFSRLLSLMTAFLLLDTDDSRRWAGIRRCLTMADNLLAAIPADGVHPMGLEAWQKDAQALSDTAKLLMIATDGQANFRTDKKFLRFIDYPVSAHLGNGAFVNPDGQPTPSLDGETMFKIGDFVKNGSLCRLGAAIGRHKEYSGGASVTDKMLTALIHKKYLAEPARFPLRTRVSLPIGMLIGAYAGGFHAAITGGSRAVGHPDAGNLYLTHMGEPVFFDLGTKMHTARCHSVPSVNGISPAKGFGGAKDLEARFEDAFTYLLVNLAPAFPKEAGVRSWQRTVMLSPHETRVRIIEAYELSSPAEEIRLRFVTPVRPERNSDCSLRIGKAVFSWEGGFKAEIEKLENGFVIEIIAGKCAARGNFAFVVAAG